MHYEVLCESYNITLDFNWFSLQQGVFDTSLQKIANVIPTAAVKQSAEVHGPLVMIFPSHIDRAVNALAVTYDGQWMWTVTRQLYYAYQECSFHMILVYVQVMGPSFKYGAFIRD